MYKQACLAVLALTAFGCETSTPPGTPSGTSPQTAASGPAAKDFSLKDVDGNTVTLSGLRGKGVLLSFWFLG